MPYHFVQSDDGIAEGIRRIALSQLAAGLANLEGDNPASAASIHNIRRHIKRLRGLIRLASPAFPDFERENIALRDTARSLGAMRDGDVMAETLDMLAKGRKSLPVLRKSIRSNRSAARDPKDMADTIETCRTTLAAIRDRVPDWTILGDDFSAAHEGLRLTYRAAQHAMADVHDDPSDHRIHQWRKRVKDTHYQMLLMEPVWPEVIRPRVQAADTLGELLGTHHDLSVFASHAASLTLPEQESLFVATQVPAAQDAILQKALPIGHRLFAGKAGAIADLWFEWWQIWRKEA